jgi:hypothetical protein
MNPRQETQNKGQKKTIIMQIETKNDEKKQSAKEIN